MAATRSVLRWVLGWLESGSGSSDVTTFTLYIDQVVSFNLER